MAISRRWIARLGGKSTCSYFWERVGAGGNCRCLTPEQDELGSWSGEPVLGASRHGKDDNNSMAYASCDGAHCGAYHWSLLVARLALKKHGTAATSYLPPPVPLLPAMPTSSYGIVPLATSIRITRWNRKGA
jgi:hypothetical protein